MLSVDNDSELPVLEPVRPGAQETEEDEPTVNQAILTMSFQDWMDLKEALQVTTPAIVHPK